MSPCPRARRCASAARLWTEPAGSGQVEGPYCAVQHDDGSESPSLGVVTCASHRSVLVGWGIVRVVTTGWRRGSDDAIGAELPPLCAGSVAAGIALAGAIAIGRRDDASCMPHEACLAQTSLASHSCCCLGQWSGAAPRTNVGEARLRPRRVCPGLRRSDGWRTLPGCCPNDGLQAYRYLRAMRLPVSRRSVRLLRSILRA